ncbi:MAG: HEPN domain-containing protein [Kiritimatiellales bacterium]|nr:HEPN domain-containing protein [Kiritimatiellota bacterium]MBL7016157.1 HEPN domain-containing protein [Kiritimatiellales bacterium]
MRPEREFALEWLHKARNDLLSAKAVLASEYGITDVPCFHAQQAVEKALKGLLTWHGVSFGKTHDLMVLLAAGVEIIPDLEDLRSICEELSEFAVDVRYPGGISEPPEGEAERFVSESEAILGRIKKEMGTSNGFPGRL